MAAEAIYVLLSAVLYVVYGLGLAFFLLGPFAGWLALVRVSRLRRRDEERHRELLERIYRLENLRSAPSPPVPVAAPPTEDIRAQPWRVAPPPPVAPPVLNIPPPPPTPVAAAPPSRWDFEERLRTNWLNKLGITILVIGIALFLAFQLQTLGAVGKVEVGVALSAALLGLGMVGERRAPYRALGRAGIAGGWALAFFTSYAAFHVPAAQVLHSETADLVLMLAIAALMVAHTLRYHSQAVTGLAFSLAFVTVSLSHVSIFSLTAGAVLALAVAVVAVQRQWFELELLGILGAYLNHYAWLYPVIAPMGAQRHAFPQFAASVVLLLVYWVIFRVSGLVRRVTTADQERVSNLAALLNTGLLLALFKYQSSRPELAFYGLLALGAAELSLAFIQRRRRRPAFIMQSVMGVCLLVVAFPFRYSGGLLSLLWLMEAEALLLAGVLTGERVFARLGLLAHGLTTLQMMGSRALPIYEERTATGNYVARNALAAVFAGGGLVEIFNLQWWVSRRPLFWQPRDRTALRALGAVGVGMLLIAGWLAWPVAGTAVTTAAVLLALAWLARRRREDADLVLLTHLVALLALGRAAVVNLELQPAFHGIPLRVVTVAAVVAVLYRVAGWVAPQSPVGADASLLSRRAVSLLSLYRWAGTLLLAALAWYQFRPLAVAPAWVVLGLLLLEWGVAQGDAAWCRQAGVLFLAAFARLFFVNLNDATVPGLSPRLYTVLPLALAYFYVYGRRTAGGIAAWVPRAAAWLAGGTLVAVVRFEFPLDWVIVGWAALVWAALAWAALRRAPVFLQQGLLLAALTVLRGMLHNLAAGSYFVPRHSRVAALVLTLAGLFGALPFAFRLRRNAAAAPAVTGIEPRWKAVRATMLARPEQVLFFLSVLLLTALLGVEVRSGMITIAWSAEAVAIFAFALSVGEHSFRLCGLVLLLLSVAKIVLVDVWRLNPHDRYLSFILLGAGLLLVSFLYSRFREQVRRYL